MSALEVPLAQDNIFSRIRRNTQAAAISGFLQQVFGKVALSLLVTTAFVGLSILLGVIWISLWIQLLIMLSLLIAMFVCSYNRNPKGAMLCFMLFAAAEGFFLGPLFQVLLSIPNGAFIVLASAGIVTLIFGGVYCYLAWKGKQANLSPLLLLGLSLAVLGLGILALCTGLQSLLFLHACLGVGVFTLYLVADIGKALYTSTEGKLVDEVDIESTLVAMNIYLDLLNLFLFCIELFALANSKNSSKQPSLNLNRLRDFLLLGVMPLLLIGCLIYYYFFAKNDPPIAAVDAAVAGPAAPSGEFYGSSITLGQRDLRHAASAPTLPLLQARSQQVENEEEKEIADQQEGAPRGAPLAPTTSA